MAKKKVSDDSIERSPLVGELPSTINPDKLEFSRFSDFQRDEASSNPVRIVVYIVVVVAVGVATALIVRNLIVSNNSQPEPSTTGTNTEQTEIPTQQQTFTLSTVARPDNSVTNTGANTDYRDSASLTVGESSVAVAELSLNKISYTRLTTFSRILMSFSGNQQKLPLTSITYSAAEKKLTVNFGQIGNIDMGLKKNTAIDNFVRSVNFVPSTNSFEIIVSEGFKYRVVNENGNLVIDIKSIRELEKPEQTTATTQTPTTPTDNNSKPTNNQTTTPTTPQGNRPAAPFYENDFGQATQFVSSKVTGNNLIMNNYWAWDEGSFFEFSFGRTGYLGDDYVPNSKAYFDTSVTDKVVLIWEVSNLSQATLSTKGSLSASEIESTVGISLAGANFNKVEFVELKDGTAKYRIELKRKADFKLLTQDTYDGTTQIISIRIKD